MKKLREIIDLNHQFLPFPDEDFSELVVADICEDSRQATPGCLFAALPGSLADGRTFVADAISRGAKYILQESENGADGVEFDADAGIYFFHAKHVRREWARVASKFFPSSFERVVAVTGTNGKSSIVDFVRQILTFVGLNAASIGTLGVISSSGVSQKIPENLTSPGPLALHKILHKLSGEGVRHIALEASSHGLVQDRMSAIRFDVCAFTNLSHDHLDYHETIASYWTAKRRLFTELADPDTIFVINADDAHSDDLRNIAQQKGNKVVDYGKTADDFKIVAISVSNNNQLATISMDGIDRTCVLPLFGEFQVHNAAGAAAICHSLGLPIDGIAEALAKLHFVPGRLELVTTFVPKTTGMIDGSDGAASSVPAMIFTDYAHTPDALRNAIVSLRRHTKNKIITVFGCGGDRDQQKRAPMGAIAEKFSDMVIVTDDNPRHENPDKIRSMILAGCDRIGAGSIEIADRKCAIAYAIDKLSWGDTLLVAGKGHESYQQIGDEFHYVSDKEVILDWITK
jgi:UDP-N-acetylmuramoyl-L-alanyl-D-glutamate--2,6-diaminopimelate ligase